MSTTPPVRETGQDPTGSGHAATDSEVALAVSGLRMTYGEVTAVSDVSFSATVGEVTAVLGPNGAGKSTTIETCEGYRKVQGGSVRVLGLDPADSRLRPRVGVMLQSGGAWSSITAMKMLRHVARMYAAPLDVDQLGERLALHGIKAPYRRMSGGEKQRLALACAVVGRPELLFLDEPTAGLDPHARLAVWELVRDLRTAGVSVVLTTHLMDEAEDLADRIVILDAGTVVADGPLIDLTSATDGLTFRSTIGLNIANLLGALPAGCRAQEFSPGAYRIDGPIGPAEIATTTAWCSGQGAPMRDLNIGRRSLEDLFLELTGRSLRP